MDFREFSIAELVDDVQQQRRSAEGLAAATLASIAEHGAARAGFVAVHAEDAVLARAREIDARIAAGNPVGPLAGMPLAVKDLEDARGLVSTYGSALFADQGPAERDSLLVERLQDAGAVVVGKTNTPEFGCKGVTDNPTFGATANPFDAQRSAGGSSGGSAAALALGIVPLATGSDGGGSIRIPAAQCGLSGFKPSQGRVPLSDPSGPTTGLLAVRSPMARTMADTLVALECVRGDDAHDVFGLPDDDYSWQLAVDAARLPERVLFSATLGFGKPESAVVEVCRAALARLADAGVEVVEIDGPFADSRCGDPVRHWWTLWSAAMARKLGDRHGTADFERIDPALQQIIVDGMATTGADYARAIDACHDLNVDLESAFRRAPILLAPTCSTVAPRLTDEGVLDGRATAQWVEMTLPFNMTRSPVATVCAGLSADGLPVGLQVIGRQRADVDVLCAASTIEAVLGGPARPG